MIHESIVGCIGRTPLVRLRRLFPYAGVEVVAKLELMNPGGSVKDRPARFIIEHGLRSGELKPGMHIIESTSGNLGIALAMLAKIHGLNFTCVVDPKIARANLQLIERLGARIERVEEPDDQGGYLKNRIARVERLLAEIPGSVWINQYANARNWQAHYYGEGEEIAAELDGAPDHLVVGVSTCGTITGLARRLRELYPGLRVIAVDAVGSVIFGPPGPRELPGLGASRVPELLQRDEVDEVVHVRDSDAALGCRLLLRHEGIFAGGSSGSVVAALRLLLPRLPRPCRVLTLLPDRGERYLDTVYDDDWLMRVRARERAAQSPARHRNGIDERQEALR